MCEYPKNHCLNGGDLDVITKSKNNLTVILETLKDTAIFMKTQMETANPGETTILDETVTPEEIKTFRERFLNERIKELERELKEIQYCLDNQPYLVNLVIDSQLTNTTLRTAKNDRIINLSIILEQLINTLRILENQKRNFNYKWHENEISELSEERNFYFKVSDVILTKICHELRYCK